MISPGTHGDSIYGLDFLIDGSLVSSLRFDKLPAANYLEGVLAIYRVEPFALANGTVIANQIETGKPRNFLFHFPFDASQYRDGARLSLEIIAHDFAGNKSSAKVWVESSLRPRGT